MSTNRQDGYYMEESYEWPYQQHETYRGRHIRQGAGYRPARPSGLWSLARRLLMGLAKVAVALRYQLSRLFGAWPLPWWKVGLALLAIYIFTQKDIQFSINLKAPLGAIPVDEEEHSTRVEPVDEMGLARNVARTERTPEAKIPSVSDESAQAYIKRFRGVAIAEMERYGIPASVKMAQALLESEAGQRAAAKRDNNHFGRPLAAQHFQSAWESWRAHSYLILQNYPELMNHGVNYKKWARGLKNAGYSPSADYDRQLVDIIERYQLQRLDQRR
jgi:hypothetical protein